MYIKLLTGLKRLAIAILLIIGAILIIILFIKTHKTDNYNFNGFNYPSTK